MGFSSCISVAPRLYLDASLLGGNLLIVKVYQYAKIGLGVDVITYLTLLNAFISGLSQENSVSFVSNIRRGLVISDKFGADLLQ